mgnify:CR=1 FL=1
MTALALLQASLALAFDPRTANDASQQRGTMLGRAALNRTGTGGSPGKSMC